MYQDRLASRHTDRRYRLKTREMDIPRHDQRPGSHSGCDLVPSWSAASDPAPLDEGSPQGENQNNSFTKSP